MALGSDEFDEAFEDARGSAAQKMAKLSEAIDAPRGVTVREAFEPDDVDFDIPGWVHRLDDVQGWLGFGVLTAEDPQRFVADLVGALGFDRVTDAVQQTGSLVLNLRGLEALNARLDQAEAFQELFLNELSSEGGTPASAAQMWASGWDDVDPSDLDEAYSEPVQAKAATWLIDDFAGYARAGKLDLAPSYQRSDVWSKKPRQMLIESIVKGIPLPSVILLEDRKPGKSATMEVVDGKQRLTSILRFIGAHPAALERVREAHEAHPDADLMSLFATNYPKFKRAWKSVRHETLTSSLEDRYQFPFPLTIDPRRLAGPELEPLRGKYYTDIKGFVITVGGAEATIEEVFQGKTTEYSIPIIRYTKATTRQIHDVFNLYNKQGVPLNAEEIRNAVFHVFELTPALLVAAGDVDSHADIDKIAPSLRPEWDRIAPLSKTLASYGFRGTRYQRTKILGWIAATLLVDHASARYPSTAKHIDRLFERIRDDEKDPLRTESSIRAVVAWLAESVNSHAEFDDELWDPVMKDGNKGDRWQELTLVASVVAVAAAVAVLGDEFEERAVELGDRVRKTTAGLVRPPKTQTASQWGYIRRVVEEVLRAFDVDPQEASDCIRQRFGSSGIASLMTQQRDDEL